MAGALRAHVDATTGIPPAVTAETAPFWDAAKEGRLLVERCSACGAESFPPRGICRACRSRATSPVEVTGPGVVYSFTVNHQRWLPDLQVPYAVVLVEFPAHPGVRVVGRLRGAHPTRSPSARGSRSASSPAPVASPSPASPPRAA
jgi:uncharacterized protein